MTWLVLGLGNPGERNARTPHNVGAQLVERMAYEAGERFRRVRFISVESAEVREPGERLALARSLQYMNVSGPPFASLARKLRVGPDRIVACHDEIDLPFGALRIKFGGSSAGHHGLDSLVGALRTPDFFRIRMGVGRPPGRPETHPDWLLEPFSKREQPEVEVLVAEAVDAVRSLVRDGLAVTQDRYNRGGSPRG
jgi:PTH1 family peptidyl-tRNA hydrolase